MIRRPPRSTRTGHPLSLHDALPIYPRQDLAADALDGGGVEARHGERGADQVERRLAVLRQGAQGAAEGIEAGIEAEIEGEIGDAALKDRKSTRLNSSH